MRKQILIIIIAVTAIAALMSISMVRPTPTMAFMVKARSRATHVSKAAKHKIPTRARFLGWRGNKLLTTAGTFVITDSVKVVDFAGTRAEEAGSVTPTSREVQFFYKNRRLVKVIIK